jgi:GPH family glycoside/pentoside/hexuronide:cation symporter
MESASTSPPKVSKVPAKVLAAYSFGTIGANYTLNTINALTFPIYNVALGIDAVMLGWAMSVPRVIDAFVDPMVGWASDNSRSRWGRRRPFIMAGAVPLAILAALLWMPPHGIGKNALLGYFLVLSIFYYVAFSFCAVPLNALGFELSNDYNERTRIQAWSAMVSLLGGLSIQWLYKLTLLPMFGGNELVGVRWVGALVAVIILAAYLVPAIVCKERAPQGIERPIKLTESVRLTLKSIPFRYLASALFLVYICTFVISPCLLCINLYGICGSKEYAAKVLGWAGTVQVLAAFIGVPCNNALSKLIGKKAAILTCLGIGMVGVALYTVTLTPAHPYLQLVSNFAFGWGIQGVWVLSNSMTADICDDDELICGGRREGFFASALLLLSKGGLALAALGSGYLLHFSGYRENIAPSTEVLSTMKQMLIGLQLVGMAGAGVLLWFYPLTEARVGAIRAELNSRTAPAA